MQSRLADLIGAGFAGLFVETEEPDEAISAIRAMASAEGHRVLGFDDQGNLSTEPAMSCATRNRCGRTCEPACPPSALLWKE